MFRGRSANKFSNGSCTEHKDPDKDLDKKHKNGTLHVVFISLLLDLIGFTIILPLLPSILDYYRVHDENGLYSYLMAKINVIQGILGTPEKFNSVLFGVFLSQLLHLFNFFKQVFDGISLPITSLRLQEITFDGNMPKAADMVGIALSYVVWGLSKTFSLFVLARIIGGICKGNVSLSTAIVTDVSTQKTRGRGMAMVGIAFSVGFIVGPIIGAIVSKRYEDYGTVPSIIAMTLSIINIIFIAVSLEETLPENRRTLSISTSMNTAFGYINPKSLFTFQPINDISKLELTKLKKIGLVYFLYLFLYSGLEFTLTFLTHMRFNYSSMDQGKMFLFMGIVMIIAQGGFVRRIPPGKEIMAAIMGLILIIPSFILIGIAFNSKIFYFGLFLYALSTSCVVPCLTTVASSCGSVGEKGTVMGIFRSIGALARAIGPIFASIGYWSLGPTLSYSIGGLLLFIPMFMLRSVK
ncbi:Major facilitator superfamily domain-containing protein 10 [Nymphon striatum]|nr:Major facilitator superfamily domain-containing protein 10 [Nymphon striatum]